MNSFSGPGSRPSGPRFRYSGAGIRFGSSGPAPAPAPDNPYLIPDCRDLRPEDDFLQPIIRFPYGAPFEFCLSLYSILHTRYSHFPLFLNNLPHLTLHLLNNLNPFGCQEKPKASPRIISGSPGVRGRGIAINPAMIRIDPVTTLAAWTTLSIHSRYPFPPPRKPPAT